MSPADRSASTISLDTGIQGYMHYHAMYPLFVLGVEFDQADPNEQSTFIILSAYKVVLFGKTD